MPQSKFIKPKNILLIALVRIGIVSVIFIYCLFAIVFISVPVSYNIAECKRLETNYVTCQQYETSIDLTIWAIANLFSLPIEMSNSRFSYQLKGTEIYSGVLYLETNSEPILYKHRLRNRHVLISSAGEANSMSKNRVNDSQSYKTPIDKVTSLMTGKGYAKMTLYLENLPKTSAIYLFSCLSIGVLIIGFSYYLDKKLVTKNLR